MQVETHAVMQFMIICAYNGCTVRPHLERGNHDNYFTVPAEVEISWSYRAPNRAWTELYSEHLAAHHNINCSCHLSVVTLMSIEIWVRLILSLTMADLMHMASELSKEDSSICPVQAIVLGKFHFCMAHFHFSLFAKFSSECHWMHSRVNLRWLPVPFKIPG